MENKRDVLPIRSVIAFGLGGSMYFIDIMFISFIMFFYTNVFGLDPGKVGVMLMVAKIWDGINDPIIGMLEDRTRTKWGKARPFLLFASVPTALMMVLTFAAPDLSPDAKLVWAYCTYIGLGMLYTVGPAAMMALVPLMTQDASQRVRLNQARMIGNTVLGIVVSAVSMKLVAGVGYMGTAIVFGAGFVVCMLILFFNSKEIDYDQLAVHKKKIRLVDQIRTVFGNPHCMKIAIGNFFVAVGGGVVGGSMLYYLTDYMGNANLFSVVQPISFAASIITVLATGAIIKKFGKKKTALLAMAISMFSLIVRLITKDTSVPVFLAMQVVLTMAAGMYSVCLIPLFADSVEYGEEKTGIRAEALTMTSYTLFSKIGSGVGTAICGFASKAIKYVPNQQQTEETLEGLRHLNVTSYLIAFAIAFLIFLTYSLSEEQVDQIRQRKMAAIAALSSYWAPVAVPRIFRPWS